MDVAQVYGLAMIWERALNAELGMKRIFSIIMYKTYPQALLHYEEPMSTYFTSWLYLWSWQVSCPWSLSPLQVSDNKSKFLVTEWFHRMCFPPVYYSQFKTAQRIGEINANKHDAKN